MQRTTQAAGLAAAIDGFVSNSAVAQQVVGKLGSLLGDEGANDADTAQ